MNRLLIALAALLTAGVLSAAAQSTSGPAGSPTAPNSGAGVQGMPGNKSGPAVRSDGSTGNQQTGSAGQDASKIQGMPGNKSGPAAKPPSSK
jgi:hypothetical protein